MKVKKLNQQTLMYGIWVVSGVLLFTAGFFFGGGFDNEKLQKLVRQHDNRYAFIGPLLICQTNEDSEDNELAPLEHVLEDVLTTAQANHQITDGSVYFRDLNSGRWVGVNEDQGHAPGSLLKVPLMMAYYKESQTNPNALTQQFRFIREAGDVDPLTPNRFLESGRRYSANDLIRGMITQSDNSAKDVLTEHANTTILEETYSVLGIADPYGTSTETYEISAKQYGLFFRVLYNATLLGRRMSNEALDLLSESEFKLGLRAGVPEQIQIAHKYGVRSEEGESPKVELSDCGIIYTSSPYLLCVMVDGMQPYVLADVIKEVSKTVYESVSDLKDN